RVPGQTAVFVQVPERDQSPTDQGNATYVKKSGDVAVAFAFHHASEYVQLHGNEVFGLVFRAEKGFPYLQGDALGQVSGAPKQKNALRRQDGQTGQLPDHGRIDGADDHAAKILWPGEAFMRGIF